MFASRWKGCISSGDYIMSMDLMEDTSFGASTIKKIDDPIKLK